MQSEVGAEWSRPPANPDPARGATDGRRKSRRRPLRLRGVLGWVRNGGAVAPAIDDRRHARKVGRSAGSAIPDNGDARSLPPKPQCLTRRRSFGVLAAKSVPPRKM